MSIIQGLSPTTKPPQKLAAVHKAYLKGSIDALTKDKDVLDFHRLHNDDIQNARLKMVRELETQQLAEIFTRFEDSPLDAGCSKTDGVRIYEHLDLPGKSADDHHAVCYTNLSGLQFLPSFLPKNTQRTLVSRLLHRDLPNPSHKTNVHFHHNLPYAQSSPQLNGDGSSLRDHQATSFFHTPPICSKVLPAIDSTTHKDMTISQFLNRKLRWMTLGGQYDWTQKAYPEGAHPDFPEDLSRLTRDVFPDIRPEAAIVNFYSPGDILGIHRDVSENSDAGLVSISLGCDALFIAGLEDPFSGATKYVVVRLRSGDVIYMNGPSRFAWHSIPQIMANTCPPWLSDWPAEMQSTESEHQVVQPFEAWSGWMAKKRINVNIRQMRD
ncbi:MAG: hypothetical protein Q9219_000345 [cf. Caloplaca sp. 3 TL-2023]